VLQKICVYKKVRDNIPGFRDTDVYKIQCFTNPADAEKLMEELNKKEGGSVYHSGYGAGSGSVDTSFYIEEENEEVI